MSRRATTPAEALANLLANRGRRPPLHSSEILTQSPNGYGSVPGPYAPPIPPSGFINAVYERFELMTFLLNAIITGGGGGGTGTIAPTPGVWFVSQGAPVAGATGSISNPFPTINQALTAAATGDEVMVFKGDYNERLLLTDAKDYNISCFGTVIVGGDFPGQGVVEVSGAATGVIITGMQIQQDSDTVGSSAFKVTNLGAAATFMQNFGHLHECEFVIGPGFGALNANAVEITLPDPAASPFRIDISSTSGQMAGGVVLSSNTVNVLVAIEGALIFGSPRLEINGNSGSFRIANSFIVTGTLTINNTGGVVFLQGNTFANNGITNAGGGGNQVFMDGGNIIAGPLVVGAFSRMAGLRTINTLGAPQTVPGGGLGPSVADFDSPQGIGFLFDLNEFQIRPSTIISDYHVALYNSTANRNASAGAGGAPTTTDPGLLFAATNITSSAVAVFTEIFSVLGRRDSTDGLSVAGRIWNNDPAANPNFDVGLQTFETLS